MADFLSSSARPKVIALVPAYNPGNFLRPSIASLIDQVPDRPHIVIIDDGCNDGSIESLHEWEKDGLIEVRRNPHNLGKAESLNRAFLDYDADYFIIQDADDISYPNRVERQIAFMEANPKLGCSSGFIEYINAKGRQIGRGTLDLLSEDRLNEYLAGDEPFGLFCPAVILRAAVVKKVDLQFRSQFWPADDIDLWNRIAEEGYLVLAQPETLVQYRIHGKSAVTSSFIRTRMQYEWLRTCLRKRRKCMPEPTKEEFLAEWNRQPWWVKLNRYRKIRSKAFYRGAGFAMAEHRVIQALLQGLAAGVLQPEYALRRAMIQLTGKDK